MITIEDVKEADSILIKDNIFHQNKWLNGAILTRNMYEYHDNTSITIIKDFEEQKRCLFFSIACIQEVSRNTKIYGGYYL